MSTSLLFRASAVLGLSAAAACAQCDYPWFPHRQASLPQADLVALDLNGGGLLELVALSTDAPFMEIVTFDDGPQPVYESRFSNDIGTAFTAADFDGDGDDDLLVYRPSLASLQLLRNTDQGLEEGPTIPAPAGSTCATDFDTDGDTDIALVANDLLRVYLNDGAANFTEGPSLALTAGYLRVHPAKLDADGLPDLVAYMWINSTATIVPIRQNPPGQLEAMPTVTARLRAIGDADGDGYTDVIAVPMDLYRCDGNGAFGAAQEIMPGYDEAKLLADLDRDGDNDLVANSLDSGLRVLTNDGQGNFTELPGNVGDEYAWGPVITPDMDSDGNPDLVTTRRVRTDIWLGKGDATFDGFPALPVFAGAIRRITLGDLDGDGDTDLIAVGDNRRHSGERNLAALVNDGAGQLTQIAYVTTPAAGYLEPAVLADFDLDGDLDAALQTNGQISLFENTEADPFSIIRALPNEFNSQAGLLLFGADLNNDGLQDLVTTGSDAGWGVRTFLNTGGWAFTPAFLPTPGYDVVIAAADFDRDGYPDVIVADSDGRAMAMCFGLGDGSVTLPFQFSEWGAYFPHGYVCDLNNDDAPDMLIQEIGGDRFHVFLNDGFGGLYQTMWERTYDQPRGIGFGDLDGDGIEDVVMSEGWTNDIAGARLSDGAGSLSPPTEFSTGMLHLRGTQVADMNGDGANDIVIAGNTDPYSGGRVAIAFNPCAPPPCPGDFNHDGQVDTTDFIAYLNAWAQQHTQDCTGGGCSADINADGTVDTLDFIAFLGAWAQGC